MKFVLSVACFTVACYFLDKYGIGLIKTPTDFLAIVCFFAIGNAILHLDI